MLGSKENLNLDAKENYHKQVYFNMYIDISLLCSNLPFLCWLLLVDLTFKCLIHLAQDYTTLTTRSFPGISESHMAAPGAFYGQSICFMYRGVVVGFVCVYACVLSADAGKWNLKTIHAQEEMTSHLSV